MVGITHLLKRAVRAQICSECHAAEFASLSLDGWSDPGKRRYQGVTCRLISPEGEVSLRLLAFKYVQFVHENASELYQLTQWVENKYGIGDKLVNRGTDRASINLAHSRMGRGVPTFFGDLWMPCACHLLNNFLDAFMVDVRALVHSVFNLQAIFDRRPCFVTYLERENAPLRAIPSFCQVRWYSAAGLFNALETLWPHMVGYAREERVRIPDLTDEVLQTISALKKLANCFVKAQLDLESDAIGTGSRFPGHLMGVRHCVANFSAQTRTPVPKFEQKIDSFLTTFRKQWHVFVMQAIVNPTVSIEVHRVLDQESYQGGRRRLSVLIQEEVEAARARLEPGAFDDPPSDDFITVRASAVPEIIDADAQIAMYLNARPAHRAENDYWQKAPRDLAQLRTVARKALAILTTSAASERVFSVAGILCGDRQMAMTGDTVSARMMIQANWPIAITLLQETLEKGPRAWAEAESRRSDKRAVKISKWWVSLIQRLVDRDGGDATLNQRLERPRPAPRPALDSSEDDMMHRAGEEERASRVDIIEEAPRPPPFEDHPPSEDEDERVFRHLLSASTSEPTTDERIQEAQTREDTGEESEDPQVIAQGRESWASWSRVIRRPLSRKPQNNEIKE
jgi:hypothetical protein